MIHDPNHMHDGDGDQDHMSDEQFCDGDGRVMLPGFTAANSEDNPCVLFLFEGAAVDTRTKYAVAVLGVFAIGFVNEMIRHFRNKLARESKDRNDGTFCRDVMLTFLFAVQMFLAYALMLLVMLYEYVFLIFIILGLMFAHLVSLRLSRREQAAIDAAKTAEGTKAAELRKV